MASLSQRPQSTPSLSPAADSQLGAFRRLREAIEGCARADGAYLVPLRLFIGIGWLRACMEKAILPGWHDGSALTTFLQGQVSQGAVVFPFYNALIRQLFLPHVVGLGWIVVIGQLLSGLAILVGCCTRAALWGGLFMNLNFLLAGVPNPGAFYIPIQTIMLLANTGAIAGVDGALDGRLGKFLGKQQWVPAFGPVARRVGLQALALFALASAAYAGAHVTDTSPAGSVKDPAMILAIMAIMVTLWSLLALLRLDGGGND